MITVEKVTTRRQQKEFINFPLKLYKGNKCYAPALYMDERKLFRKDYVYNDMCEHVYFNAYKDGKMAGRISGISSVHSLFYPFQPAYLVLPFTISRLLRPVFPDADII